MFSVTDAANGWRCVQPIKEYWVYTSSFTNQHKGQDLFVSSVISTINGSANFYLSPASRLTSRWRWGASSARESLTPASCKDAFSPHSSFLCTQITLPQWIRLLKWTLQKRLPSRLVTIWSTDFLRTPPTFGSSEQLFLGTRVGSRR